MKGNANPYIKPRTESMGTRNDWTLSACCFFSDLVSKRSSRPAIRKTPGKKAEEAVACRLAGRCLSAVFLHRCIYSSRGCHTQYVPQHVASMYASRLLFLPLSLCLDGCWVNHSTAWEYRNTAAGDGCEKWKAPGDRHALLAAHSHPSDLSSTYYCTVLLATRLDDIHPDGSRSGRRLSPSALLWIDWTAKWEEGASWHQDQDKQERL